MSKLTHSTDEGMRQVDERRAREDGEAGPIEKRRWRLVEFRRQFMAEGFGRNEADRRAFMMVKAGLKPKVE